MTTCPSRSLSRNWSTPPSGLRLPRRAARLRLTILYGGVCPVFGVILLTVTYLLTRGALTMSAVPHPAAASGQSRSAPSVQQENQGQLQNGAEQITVDRQLLVTRSGIALVIVSAAAVGAGWLLAGRVLRPLSTITATTRRISASGLHERLALQGPDDELKELGDTRPGTGSLGLNVRTGIQPATLDGDPFLVQRLVANLIDNAVHHNIPGGDVQVATRTSGGHAVLSVANSRQAIPPDEVSRLFQPFQRLGPRRARRDGGHGLGLSIVKAIATAYGAAITPTAQPGGGLAIDVTFRPPLPWQNCSRPQAAKSRGSELE